jgi:hypothetical protein
LTLSRWIRSKDLGTAAFSPFGRGRSGEAPAGFGPVRNGFGAVGPAAGALLVFALFWWVSPPANPSLRLCPFYWLTARPCPLCGITRAFCALAKGRFGEAIQFHALSPLAFVMLFSLFWNFRWRARLWTWGLIAIGIYGTWRAVIA